jgi:hypothetical protein
MEQNTQGCQQNGCGACCGGGCGGRGGTLSLTAGELELLRALGQVAFLPVARRADEEEPVCLEYGRARAEEMGWAIRALRLKGLLRVDEDMPLTNFDYGEYQGCQIRGSMALTLRGQQVVEQLDIQGIEE